MSVPLMPQPAPRPLTWPAALSAIRAVLGAEPTPVYLVGGVVRDAFWGLAAHDIDLAVPANAFAIARHIADALEGAFYKLDPERETGRVIATIAGQRTIIDVATFRGTDLLDDLTGRDFTINAVAAPLESDDQVIDPLGGLDDAARRILRRCSTVAIQSDPVRALRAVRMAVRFNLRIEPETLADIRREGPRLASTSPERLRDEFIALLGGASPTRSLRNLAALDLLPIVLPEATPRPGSAEGHNTWEHTLRITHQLESILTTISPGRTDNTAARAGLGMIVYYLDRYRAQLQEHIGHQWPNERPHRAIVILAALLGAAEAADPATRARLRGEALRLSRSEIERLAAILRHQGRPLALCESGIPSRREVYRVWHDTGPAGVDCCLLALATYLAAAGPALSTARWSNLLEGIAALLDGAFGEPSVTALPVLITGHDLMQHFKLPPGQRIGELLDQIQEEQAAGTITTREEALAFAATLL